MSEQWPGWVKRDDLIKFLQDRTPAIQTEANKIFDAMQDKRLSDEDYETLNDKYYMNLGRLQEMRTVVDWCFEHKKDEQEMESQHVS